MNIHLIVRYIQLQRDNPTDDQLALVRMTIHKMVKPCLYTALTSIIGFGSLVVSDIKPVIDFYKQSNLLHIVNGETSITEISNEISGLIEGIKG